jgi:HD superfamily phosphohydrolase
VSLVYPAANHSRQEHSLGVYRVAIEYLTQLAGDERFAAEVSRSDAETFLVAALLHDVGHWPFCHPIEDMRLPSVPSHEDFASSYLCDDSIATILRDEWGVEPAAIMRLLSGKIDDPASRILRSMLSGPIDVDKFDYLMRDSLHAGVPYGRHFDQRRLIGSLCLNQAGDGLAITEKGRTAAEMMVFARYVMFSEVYWHHAVRSATAMLQRAFFELHESLELDPLLRLAESEMITTLRAAATGTAASELVEGLFGPTRRLYKQVAEFSVLDQPELFGDLARRPYPWLVACAGRLAELVSRETGADIAPHQVLLDAPPVKREVEFNLDVYDPKRDTYRRLGDVSPVVQTLAREQFDNYVKRVRVFVHPRIGDRLKTLPNISASLADAIASADG